MASSNTESIRQPLVVDFNNTEIAFSHKSNSELKRTAWLFRLMNKQWLVNAGSNVGLWLSNVGIRIFNPIVKATIFRQFCGGTSLENSADAIDHLVQRHTLSVLDFGAEAKSKEEDFDRTLEENLRAIDFAGSRGGVPVVSSKVTALASDEILEKSAV